MKSVSLKNVSNTFGMFLPGLHANLKTAQNWHHLEKQVQNHIIVKEVLYKFHHTVEKLNTNSFTWFKSCKV